MVNLTLTRFVYTGFSARFLVSFDKDLSVISGTRKVFVVQLLSPA